MTALRAIEHEIDAHLAREDENEARWVEFENWRDNLDTGVLLEHMQTWMGSPRWVVMQGAPGQRIVRAKDLMFDFNLWLFEVWEGRHG